MGTKKEAMELKISGEPPSPLLIFSSLLIFVPALVAFFLKRYGDMLLMGLLATTSTWFHYSHTPTALAVDNSVLYLAALHCFLLAMKTPWGPLLFVLAFGQMLVLHTYGQRNNCFCFDSDPDTADLYHASMHVNSSFLYSIALIAALPSHAKGIFEFIPKGTILEKGV